MVARGTGLETVRRDRMPPRDDGREIYTSSIWSFADNTLTLVREAVLTAGYRPLTTLAEKSVVSYAIPSWTSVSLALILSELNPTAFYENISVGRLRIVTSEHTYEFSDVLRIVSERKNRVPS